MVTTPPIGVVKYRFVKSGGLFTTPTPPKIGGANSHRGLLDEVIGGY